MSKTRDLANLADLNFDSGTLVVDKANDRVGVLNATPSHPFQVGTDDLIVDASGNLLVGTTDSVPGNNSGAGNIGIALQGSEGQVEVASEGAGIVVNRVASDGDIALFRKDGTTVGSIGYISSGLYIDGESGHAGLRFGGADISPRDGGADADAAIQLGSSSNRFTDLYLSGGVYLGGTGSANYLDDYEEGTWTPEVRASSGTVLSASTKSGHYTKIGRLVHVNCDITNIVTTGATSSNAISVHSLPFTVDQDLSFGSCVSSVVTLQNSRTQITARANTGNYIEFFANGSGQGFTNVDVGDLSSGVSDLYFSVAYYTDQ